MPLHRRTLLLLLAGTVIAACGGDRPDPPRRYVMTGQVLSLSADAEGLVIRHDDIPGYMPAMTMTFPVASAALLDGREPGELITATLEVDDRTYRLTTVERTGMAPLPEGTNAIALAGGILDIGDPMPDAALIDQHDRRRTLAEWRGTPTLITFIYTRCPLPTFCPLMDRHFQSIQRQIATDPALAGRLRLLSISFDPEYDTPAVLTTHAAALEADPDVWTFLTGDRVTVDRLAGRFGVGVLRGPDGATEITHNLRTALFAADGTLVALYTGSEWTPRTVLTDLRAHLAR